MTPTSPTLTRSADDGASSPHRAERSLALVIGLAAVPALAWAIWPLRPTTVPTVEAADSNIPGTRSAVPFDTDAFGTPLWVAPPSPPAPPEPEPEPAPPAPPPPLKVQLLSILREPTGNRAMFYDPDTKKVLTLGIGDHVGASSDGRTIASITEREVEIAGPRGSQTLSLREPASSLPSNSKPGRKR